MATITRLERIDLGYAYLRAYCVPSNPDQLQALFSSDVCLMHYTNNYMDNYACGIRKVTKVYLTKLFNTVFPLSIFHHCCESLGEDFMTLNFKANITAQQIFNGPIQHYFIQEGSNFKITREAATGQLKIQSISINVTKYLLLNT